MPLNSGRPKLPERELNVAFWNYDRTLPLVDGRVGLPGYSLQCSILRPEEAFARAFQGAEFDVTELSLSNSITAASKGPFEYRLIPVFLSRAFRLDSLFAAAAANIEGPQDLRGRTVGVQEYDMTAAVVVRGVLRDCYGIEAQDIRWRVGERARTKPLEFPFGTPPEGVEIEILPAGRRLEDRLLDGELDAMISLHEPESLKANGGRIVRVFDDPAAAEQAYFRASGVFPIMHAVGVRASLLTSDPALGRRLYDAFVAAKEMAVAELEVSQASKITLPWARDALARARQVLGPDVWPYGIEANRHALETALRWSWQDGLQAKRLAMADLFDPLCWDT